MYFLNQIMSTKIELKESPLRCFFAFEGYNSQGLALRRLSEHHPDFRWECVGRSEIDKYAIAAADAIFPENKDKNFGDISKIDWSQVPDFDLFTYSFPCTDISSTGLQRGMAQGSGTASSLLWECERAIEIKRPKYLLMENVKALIGNRFMPYFLKWQNILIGLGYTNYWQVMDAADYGVEQHRRRVFMVSVYGPHNAFHFPKTIKGNKAIEEHLEDYVDDYFYFNEDKVTDDIWRRAINQPRVREILTNIYNTQYDANCSKCK